ncbi:hypothetical protein Pst134EA_001111 [Puccinia striiformis f. sp. tritici]|uniref:hypothetical protein n=1 Tax=Puccinia striiformis f. sp. tritici TaxID=168172 RepID=UPI0020078BA7|nr:hypothetical protein Pst134EA_001111 [Puccinia striiformis f. sp. tritici]KAH9474060.1 hypothetical protein Pst134EA_001111 [Puccinia striiformis f. sp. tritici]
MMGISIKTNAIFLLTATLSTLHNAQLGLCHGYIKAWSADDGHTWTLGQKQDLATSSIRGFSENTGWIGSKFLTKPAIVCSSGLTPSLKVVAPSGDLFSQADQSAGKTLSVASGATVRLLINDEPHKIYPHENGHIQIYLGYCGPSETACEKFDAASISYFKILSLKHGLGSKEEFPYNKHKDGNEVKVPIPKNLPMGSYIMRIELIVFGQSSEAEGKQDQYYITCGQMALPKPEINPPISIESLESVRFPGAYKNGNIDPEDPLPGPNVADFSGAAQGPAQASSTVRQSTPSPTPSPNDSGEDEGSRLSGSVPECARACLAKKISENAEGKLGVICATPSPQPGQTQALCQCKDEQFTEAFANCSKDHCQAGCEVENAINSFSNLCGLKTKPSSCQNNNKRERPVLLI